MIELAVLIGVLVIFLSVLVYLLGFRMGGEHWQSELANVRSESASAAHQMHTLTRAAFEAMADHTDRRRESGV